MRLVLGWRGGNWDPTPISLRLTTAKAGANAVISRFNPGLIAPVPPLTPAKTGANAVILGSDPNCLPILSILAPGANKQLGSDPNITGRARRLSKTIAVSAYSTLATGQLFMEFKRKCSSALRHHRPPGGTRRQHGTRCLPRCWRREWPRPAVSGDCP